MGRFDGKVALLTGAASGIGRATAIQLAREGAAVYGMDVNAQGLAETEALIKELGGRMTPGVHDVSRRDQCFAAVQSCAEAHGRLDVLANIAGIVRFAHVPEMSEEDWDLTLAVNVSGPFFMCQAAIPHLLESGGNIVNIGSNAGLMGQAYTVAYCASKAAIVNMTRALAMEFMNAGIRVNCVCPAGTQTNLTATVRLPDGMDGKLMQRYMGMRGMTSPEQIAEVVAFVASDAASAVHGAILEADQGVTAG
jgi:NAD(P)-dependent dehydrogenase (short-subunit alcohol dehydrogenase family)